MRRVAFYGKMVLLQEVMTKKSSAHICISSFCRDMTEAGWLLDCLEVKCYSYRMPCTNKKKPLNFLISKSR